MRRKNQRPVNFTSRQVQQLKQVSRSLRTLNRAARGELRRIGYTDLTDTQYRAAGDLFGTIATRMIGALRFHDEILTAEREQQLPHRLVVCFVIPCVHCSERRHLTAHDGDDAERAALKQGPAYQAEIESPLEWTKHQAEIESLLELTNSIEDLVSRRSTLRGAFLNAFFRGINRFRLAVFQQQQHLLATAPPPEPQFELDIQFEDPDDSNICPDCHKSREIDNHDGGHNRQV